MQPGDVAVGVIAVSRSLILHKHTAETAISRNTDACMYFILFCSLRTVMFVYKDNGADIDVLLDYL